MEHPGQLGEALSKHLSPEQRAMFVSIGSYEWFLTGNRETFERALEPLAYAVKLGLRNQVKNYFEKIERLYFDDLVSKVSNLIRNELRLDGSPLSSGTNVTSLNDLDELLPGTAFSAIERLAKEGFEVRDFAAVTYADYKHFTLVLRVGGSLLKVMTWKTSSRGGGWSW